MTDSTQDKVPCVLVIDDDQSIRTYIEATLTEEGYKVVLASNGAMALTLAGIYQPDLIMLDMYMPDVDGWGFLAAYPQTSMPHAPIIAMSTDIDTKAMPGVVIGIEKPFTIDRLLVTVHQVLPALKPSTNTKASARSQ